MNYMLFKRCFDVLGSLTVLLLFSPFFVIVGCVIRDDSEGPVFFRQLRTGKGGKTFRVFKFRTMVQNAESVGSGIFTDAVDPRITRIGGYLRKTSLDELPQLINVFKGDMSVIGPRPVPLVKLDRYDHSDTRRLAVKPGITGWAQVNGRNTLTWPEKIERDLYYIRNISFLLDMKIIFKTLKYLVSREGVYSGRYRHLVENRVELKAEG